MVRVAAAFFFETKTILVYSLMQIGPYVFFIFYFHSDMFRGEYDKDSSLEMMLRVFSNLVILAPSNLFALLVPLSLFLFLNTGEGMMVVPGFDGSLYWIWPAESRDDENLGGEGRSSGGLGYKLPLNALHLTDEPRILCNDAAEASSSTPSNSDGDSGSDGENGNGRSESEGSACGLVVGERATTLFALDVDSGAVRWVREAHTGRTHVGFTSGDKVPTEEHREGHSSSSSTSAGGAHDEGSSSSSSGSGADSQRHPSREPMLLQRDEYTVRYSSVSDGTEHWNVSVALFTTVERATLTFQCSEIGRAHV